MKTILYFVTGLLINHLHAAEEKLTEVPLEKSPFTTIFSAKINISGTTFGSNRHIEEAVKRANGFDRTTIFAENVAVLIHSTEHGLRSFTVTQIAPKIFLSTRSDAIELAKSFQDFQEKQNLSEYKLILRAAGIILESPKTEIAPHPEANLALLKLVFQAGEIHPLGFLPIAKPISEGQRANGYAISYTEVSGGDSEESTFLEDKAIERSLSIHSFQKIGQELQSFLPGALDPDKTVNLIKANFNFNLKPNIKNINKLKKIILNSARFAFPESEEQKLMSALGLGASGAPVVIRQDNDLRIVGVLQKGGIFPRAFIETPHNIGNVHPTEMLFLSSDETDIAYVNDFIDVTPFQDWIHEEIEKFRK